MVDAVLACLSIETHHGTIEGCRCVVEQIVQSTLAGERFWTAREALEVARRGKGYGQVPCIKVRLACCKASPIEGGILEHSGCFVWQWVVDIR